MLLPNLRMCVRALQYGMARLGTARPWFKRQAKPHPTTPIPSTLILKHKVLCNTEPLKPPLPLLLITPSLSTTNNTHSRIDAPLNAQDRILPNLPNHL